MHKAGPGKKIYTSFIERTPKQRIRCPRIREMGHDLSAATCGCDFGNATLLNGTCAVSIFRWFALRLSFEDLILKQCMIQDPCPSVESFEKGYKPGIFNRDYDFIVVGGGAAGKN